MTTMTIMTATTKIVNRRSITSASSNDWLPEGHQVSYRQVT
jgi:hypothetical protein